MPKRIVKIIISEGRVVSRPSRPCLANVIGVSIGLYVAISPKLPRSKAISYVHITGETKNPALTINLIKCSTSLYMQFSGANKIPRPIAKNPANSTDNGTKSMYMVNGKSNIIIIGMMTKQLIIVMTMFPITEVIGKIILGK